MWDKIVNPKTGRRVNTDGVLGKKILGEFVNQLGGLGNVVIQTLPTSHSTSGKLPSAELNYCYNTITAHINARFNKLEANLASDATVSVHIAGEAGNTNITGGFLPGATTAPYYKGAYGHNLGVGLAYNQWFSKFNDSHGDIKWAYSNVLQLIDTRVSNLVTDFPNRISFGFVNGKHANKKKYHVWGANTSNWNLPTGTRIQGGGQAAHMGKQKSGVFGIITTPLGL